MAVYDAPIAFDTGTFDGYEPVPPPSPTIPVAQPTEFTYLFTNNTGTTLAILPLTGFAFDLALNAAGTWSGNLSVEDPNVRQLNWIEATAPNLTCVWVYSGSTLVYGGRVTTRQYTMSQQSVRVGGSDFVSYMDQLLQRYDYSTTWQNGAGTASMAAQMLTDALGAANTLPISVALDGTEPSEYFVPASFPISQQQTLSSLFQQLQEMGYLVGFDYACDVYQTSSGPVPYITISYPRRGRVAGTTGLTLDMGTATEFVYDEDGTRQANQIVEMATSFGGVGTVATWQPSMSVSGYPLLQAVEQHAVFSAQTFYTNNEVSASQPVLNAWGADDLAMYAYPAVAPKVTVPLFAPGLSLGDFIVGDDIRVVLNTNVGIPTNPRFPDGLDYYWRIVKASVKIKDEGLSTMALTLNLPPASTPQLPPA